MYQFVWYLPASLTQSAGVQEFRLVRHQMPNLGLFIRIHGTKNTTLSNLIWICFVQEYNILLYQLLLSQQCLLSIVADLLMLPYKVLWEVAWTAQSIAELCKRKSQLSSKLSHLYEQKQKTQRKCGEWPYLVDSPISRQIGTNYWTCSQYKKCCSKIWAGMCWHSTYCRLLWEKH